MSDTKNTPSMFSDFYIGEKPDVLETKYATYSPIYNIHTTSSEYLIYVKELIQGRIKFDTPEGKKIKKMIDNNESRQRVEMYMIYQGVKSMSPMEILHLMGVLKEQAYNQGMQDKALEIRKSIMV